MTGWTEADSAELDCLVHALTGGYFAHRERCDAHRLCPELEAWRSHKTGCAACRGDAPLTFQPGPFCLQLREHWLEHNRRGCPRCLPCPHLQRAIAEVVDWLDARRLLSKAEALREAMERVA